MFLNTFTITADYRERLRAAVAAEQRTNDDAAQRRRLEGQLTRLRDVYLLGDMAKVRDGGDGSAPEFRKVLSKLFDIHVRILTQSCRNTPRRIHPRRWITLSVTSRSAGLPPTGVSESRQTAARFRP